MDTTIWHVRPKASQDGNEKIVLATTALPSPISTDVVKCQSNFILHLTDLHFSTGINRRCHTWKLESESGDRPTMAEAISNAISNRVIGAIFVTGDLTFIGSDEEFSEARVSLTRLLGILDLDADRLVVVPGNHDIRWARDLQYYNERSPVTEASDEAKNNYKKFYTSLFRHEPETTSEWAAALHFHVV